MVFCMRHFSDKSLDFTWAWTGPWYLILSHSLLWKYVLPRVWSSAHQVCWRFLPHNSLGPVPSPMIRGLHPTGLTSSNIILLLSSNSTMMSVSSHPTPAAFLSHAYMSIMRWIVLLYFLSIARVWWGALVLYHTPLSRDRPYVLVLPNIPNTLLSSSFSLAFYLLGALTPHEHLTQDARSLWLSLFFLNKYILPSCIFSVPSASQIGGGGVKYK